MKNIIYTNEDLYKAEQFAKIGHNYDFENLFEDVLDRAVDIYNDQEERDDYEAVIRAIDDGLIYYADQWTVLKYYFTPQDANFEKAIELFSQDLLTALDYLIDNNK